MGLLRIAKCTIHLLLNLNIDYSIDFDTEMLWFAKKDAFVARDQNEGNIIIS